MNVNVVVISVSSKDQDNHRKSSKKMMSILLTKKDGIWSLPNGKVQKNKTIEESARDALTKETNVTDIYIEQLYTFDKLNNKDEGISISYVGLIDKNTLNTKLTDNTSWFDIISNIEHKDEVEMILTNSSETITFSINKKLRAKTSDRYEFIEKNSTNILENQSIVILSAIERIRNKLNYTDIVFNMMPKYFSLGELQQVYEVILGKKLLDPAFRRVIASKVEKTDKMRTDGAHRPSYLFKYINRK